MKAMIKMNSKIEIFIKKFNDYYYSHSIFHKIGIWIVSGLMAYILATIFLLPIYYTGKEFGAWLYNQIF